MLSINRTNIRDVKGEGKGGRKGKEKIKKNAPPPPPLWRHTVSSSGCSNHTRKGITLSIICCASSFEICLKRRRVSNYVSECLFEGVAKKEGEGERRRERERKRERIRRRRRNRRCMLTTDNRSLKSAIIHV